MTAPAAVLASFVKLSTLVDGTMRIVLDVEPKAAAEAFALLGAPGSPIALARITGQAAVEHDQATIVASQPAEGEPPTPEPAARETAPVPEVPVVKRTRTLGERAHLMCLGRTFYDFVTAAPFLAVYQLPHAKGSTVNHAIGVLRRYCGVESRSDLATDEAAAQRYLTLEAEYRAWQHLRAA